VKVVPRMVLPTKLLLRNSKSGGCHNCRNSKKQVTANTTAAIFQGLMLLKNKKAKRHQNITYNTPPRESFTQRAA
jgi:nitrate/TMAO reductase-like tetraheme cytochrome c subunit